ncbi:hypothetical protein AB0N89_07225 [Amycolatopsis sp. NPDC089917]|uniref:hypothetical protein n=1 Tax=Amycolatopsis sp. NPDC089917 TaxID=3155187 RepID=UPI0034262403
MVRTRLLLTTLAVTVTAVSSLFSGATATAAAGDKSRVADGWNLRTCGYAYCGVHGYTVGDQDSTTWCWKDGDGRWFKVDAWTQNGWKTGWIHANGVPRQASVPGCQNW